MCNFSGNFANTSIYLIDKKTQMLRLITVNTSCGDSYTFQKKKRKQNQTHEKGKLQVIVKNVIQCWVNKYLPIYLYK